MGRKVLLLSLVMMCGLAMGCSAQTPTTPAAESGQTPTPSLEVVTLNISQPVLKSGQIQFDLMPKDAQDKLVESPGTLRVRLWERQFVGRELELKQEWDNMQITDDDYGPFGAGVFLECGSFILTDGSTLEVTFATPDGLIFTVNQRIK